MLKAWLLLSSKRSSMLCLFQFVLLVVVLVLHSNSHFIVLSNSLDVSNEANKGMELNVRRYGKPVNYTISFPSSHGHRFRGTSSHATHQSKKKKSRLFNVSDHEVPSGPNPISNR